MTLPSSGPISVSQINQEIGQASTYSSDLNFLNNLVLPSIRPGTPNMAGFYGLSYFQKNTAGNCNGTGTNNCCENCASGNCPVVDAVIKVKIAMYVLIVELLIVQIVTVNHGYKQEIVINNPLPHIIVKVINAMHRLVTAQKLFAINYINLV